MNHMLWDDPRELFDKSGMTAMHAIAAWAVIFPFWVVVTYLLALPVLREALKRRVVIVTQTNGTPPPQHPVP
jgi:hypothetical protein